MELEMLFLEGRNRQPKCRNENGVVDSSVDIPQEIWRREVVLLEEVAQWIGL
ncbi:hypothetical protein DPMN_039456 [Dreissena polymorpha]|uniref:Uncharacterized protein n=1 Tax=Dreissena polymorpha TaxID=45954 RepID=A0A9D4CV07_DREPO|nr:hypothetical protein DPMN_039456 [Dreissena polymorpha]